MKDTFHMARHAAAMPDLPDDTHHLICRLRGPTGTLVMGILRNPKPLLIRTRNISTNKHDKDAETIVVILGIPHVAIAKGSRSYSGQT